MTQAARRSASPFGLVADAYAELLAAFAATAGLQRVWVYGSRARGDWRARSDLDLAIEAQGWSGAEFMQFKERLRQLPIVYPLDVVMMDEAGAALRVEIDRDRQLLWPLPSTARLRPQAEGSLELKDYQRTALDQLDCYLDELVRRRAASQRLEQVLLQTAGEDGADLLGGARDFPAKAWTTLGQAGRLPRLTEHVLPHSSRFDGAGRAIPNVCFKVPTGGGKTLLAAASIGRVFERYFERHTGLVLWVVPKEAIYRQTLKALRNTDHPYRQMLNVAGAGRVRILEKGDPLNRLDLESSLCVMVLMLASAARESKETLRFFRDRGDVHGFVPAEDDFEAHWQLLQAVPNLDVYGSGFAPEPVQQRQKGSIVKSSLGNVMRLVRPMVILDEGQYGYTPNALRTLDGFNPGFMLELSATPRVAQGEGTVGSNILVNVRGKDLEDEEMIKLPIHVDVRAWADWQSCLLASVEQLRALDGQARVLHDETERYIRPILLVQVERTGKDQIDPAHIHARDVREQLARLGFTDAQVREKTSEKDEIGDEELLSPASDVRVIITKQALQEGWDCSFAYVLCALAASRGQRAMTQLVGRILRLPHAAKTGRSALDACYVFCHDIGTGDAVRAIKASLEGEGLGDLLASVRHSSGDEGSKANVQDVPLIRRPGLRDLRIFLPKVTWVQDGVRRELDYDSDVLGRIDWAGVDPTRLAEGWAPGQGGQAGGRYLIDLGVLGDAAPVLEMAATDVVTLDRSLLVRALLDVAPNPWQVWGWVQTVLERLLRQYDERALAHSVHSLTERLRVDLLAQRDALAQSVFEREVRAGRIQFRLRADATDYELPVADSVQVPRPAQTLKRRDNYSEIEKSLLQPALRTPDMNDFEALFAGYLDERQALRWWHRNVARTQYGLQGWRRHKVYPDFVVGLHSSGDVSKVVLLETKGMQLAGNADTQYKLALLDALTESFMDERFVAAGELALESTETVKIECDLVFDEAWEGRMDARHFGTTH